MHEKWKPKKGDVVWVQARVEIATPDADGELFLRRGEGGTYAVYAKPEEIRPDAPAPAAMDDVAVLRRAAEIMRARGLHGAASILVFEALAIEAERAAPTPLDALRALLSLVSDMDAPEVHAARRVIAKAERGNTDV